MRALILAGGFGKRLMPLTRNIPKAMVSVGGKPVIYWQIKWLRSLGIERFVLLGGHKSDKLVKYIKSVGYSGRFEFSLEERPLGSAGALKNAEKILRDDEKFVLVNGDNVTNIDIRKLRLPGKSLCCVSLKPYRSRSGIAKIRKGLVTYFEEKPILKGYWNNLGVTLISSDLLRSLPRMGSLEQDVFPKLIKQRKLACATFTRGYHRAVDTFKDYQEIDNDLRSGRVVI
jgi:NDP-sugar pyrophosphorylase family protein